MVQPNLELSDGIVISFNGDSIKNILDVSVRDATSALRHQACDTCASRVCELTVDTFGPDELRPGPNSSGKAGYYPDDWEHRASIRCESNDCQNPELIAQTADRILQLGDNCVRASGQLVELREPVIDAAEAARDVILSRAKDEAQDAYQEVYSKVDLLRRELAEPILRTLLPKSMVVR